ncbi:ArsR/SmtB family transcription factor [Lactiplantibacillus plantarum]|uniref:ArsR/SmtB family transcription factor n=1 Tax=Lactiplantibacillus plantarum TaxID=1590 RepID=UPI001AAE34AF|nr:metalloregulator ArsR/SmtB family transcription factor [Lactiplantibacillus plantarum]MBO2703378.1 metalloregulator ArsR/SmtB family transcription factor [Lactiplantibacillus plantarum]MDN7038535.1 winged helix-turn-helix transcriptional regulator [Lactiplantibacillus plantarum]
MIHKLYNDKIVWNGKKVMIYQPFSEVHSLSIHEKILFVPSYFIWPHLSVQDVNDDIVVTYDVSKHVTQQVSSQKMETILRAVGDSTRIQILNFLKQTENTTQGLSQLLNLSESTVSRDLNILKNAELVTSRRVNKYVLYQVTGTITNLIPSFFANLPDEYIT